VEGCSTAAKIRGLCSKHGGGTRCRQEGCTKAAKAGGLCKAHGGDNRKPCSVEGCSTLARLRGLCSKHEGYPWCLSQYFMSGRACSLSEGGWV
jgi:hypothetical protein